MNLSDPETIRMRQRFFKAVIERKLRLEISERKSLMITIQISISEFPCNTCEFVERF